MVALPVTSGCPPGGESSSYHRRRLTRRRAPVDRLSALLGHPVQFSYTAWDRIVLNGYLARLQRPENLVYFFHEVVGVPAVTPEVLMSRTAPYRAWVTQYAQDHGIPLVAA